jgi:hypothetical protein
VLHKLEQLEADLSAAMTTAAPEDGAGDAGAAPGGGAAPAFAAAAAAGAAPAAPAAVAPAAVAPAAAAPALAPGGLIDSTKLWALFVLGLSYVHQSTTGFALPAMLPMISPDLHLSDFQGAMLTSGYSYLYALALVPVGLLADRVSRPKLLAVGLVLWSVLSMAASKAGSFSDLLLSRVGFAAAQATQNPVSFSLIPDLFPANKSTALAAYNCAIYLGRCAGGAAGRGGGGRGARARAAQATAACRRATACACSGPDPTFPKPLPHPAPTPLPQRAELCLGPRGAPPRPLRARAQRQRGRRGRGGRPRSRRRRCRVVRRRAGARAGRRAEHGAAGQARPAAHVDYIHDR